MFLALAVMNIIHPGTILVGPDSKLPGLKATYRILRSRKRGLVERQEDGIHLIGKDIPS